MGAGRAIALNFGHPAAASLQRPGLYLPSIPSWRVVSRPQWFLPAAIIALKVVASALAGATVTVMLWPSNGKSVSPYARESDRFGAAFAPYGETTVYRSAPQDLRGSVPAGEAEPLDADRGLPLNFPRRVQTVRFTPPADQPALPPVVSLPSASLPPVVSLPPAGKPLVAGNPLVGKPLRYLIGTEGSGSARDGDVTVVSYGTSQPAKHGISVAYGNLFDELNTRRYGPYLRTSDTAAQYNEGQIDPRGPGWEKNLREQFERRKKQGFGYIELDNPDAYKIKEVIGAIELAATYGLKVIAKNPGLMEGGAVAYVAHPNVYGIIVEKGAGGAGDMDALRRKAGKPDLPVWFVAFGSGKGWGNSVASAAKQYRNMGVTYSSAGEYGNVIDILTPSEGGSVKSAAAR
jgi:hypothetical protein